MSRHQFFLQQNEFFLKIHFPWTFLSTLKLCDPAYVSGQIYRHKSRMLVAIRLGRGGMVSFLLNEYGVSVWVVNGGEGCTTCEWHWIDSGKCYIYFVTIKNSTSIFLTVAAKKGHFHIKKKRRIKKGRRKRREDMRTVHCWVVNNSFGDLLGRGSSFRRKSQRNVCGKMNPNPQMQFICIWTFVRRVLFHI